jgi:hypothetical protein
VIEVEVKQTIGRGDEVCEEPSIRYPQVSQMDADFIASIDSLI